MSTRSPEHRRLAVARILRGGGISTQEELLAALRRGGFRATQATLSRDLARLGARRVSRPGGGTAYEMASGPGGDGTAALAGLVHSVAANGSMVVLRTHPGSAPAVARAIDLLRLPLLLGTLAGDDTIFVAPAHEGGARPLAAEIADLFGRPVGGPPGGAGRTGTARPGVAHGAAAGGRARTGAAAGAGRARARGAGGIDGAGTRRAWRAPPEGR
jgi:transcriptional regulator of arginine metabolism